MAPRDMPPMTQSRPAPPRPPVGWPLLPTPDSAGRLTFPSLADSLRQQVQVVIETARGELLMHPEFGAGLRALLYEPNTPATRDSIAVAITEALARHEARVAVTEVRVTVAGSGRELAVEIAYRCVFSGADGAAFLNLPAGGA